MSKNEFLRRIESVTEDLESAFRDPSERVRWLNEAIGHLEEVRDRQAKDMRREEERSNA